MARVLELEKMWGGSIFSNVSANTPAHPPFARAVSCRVVWGIVGSLVPRLAGDRGALDTLEWSNV